MKIQKLTQILIRIFFNYSFSFNQFLFVFIFLKLVVFVNELKVKLIKNKNKRKQIMYNFVVKMKEWSKESSSQMIFYALKTTLSKQPVS